MTPDEIVEEIVARFPGVVPKSSWGETALFYNPGKRLAHGVYFCTLKDHDGENDRASELQREGVYRLAVGLTPETYSRLFGPRPRRPAKGGAVETGHDFTERNRLMPHPVYAWMGWAQILSPTREAFLGILPHLAEAHGAAIKKFSHQMAAGAKRRGRPTGEREGS